MIFLCLNFKAYTLNLSFFLKKKLVSFFPFEQWKYTVRRRAKRALTSQQPQSCLRAFAVRPRKRKGKEEENRKITNCIHVYKPSSPRHDVRIVRGADRVSAAAQFRRGQRHGVAAVGAGRNLLPRGCDFAVANHSADQGERSERLSCILLFIAFPFKISKLICCTFFCFF